MVNDIPAGDGNIEELFYGVCIEGQDMGRAQDFKRFRCYSLKKNIQVFLLLNARLSWLDASGLFLSTITDHKWILIDP